MGRPAKQRTEAARLAGLKMRTAFPLSRIDLEYRIVSDEGALSPEVHTLKLILGSEELRQLQAHLGEVAAAMEEMAGTKQ